LNRAVALALSSSLAASAPGSPASAAEVAAIPEVVVTARRIKEGIQDIPMSVQALSGELLDESRVTRVNELQFYVPGLVVNTIGMFGVGFSLRGIGDQRIGGLSVAPHLNGVYLGDANLAIARMFDLERIEVLKGPQGTLYGRNASGGSINFITRAPQPGLESLLELSYGSFETVRAQGYVNLPMGTAAARVAFIASDGDGYIRNSVDDRRFAEDDYWGVRGSLHLAPSDDLRIDVMAQRIRDDGGSGDLWLPNPDFMPDPGDIHLTTVTLDKPYLHSEVGNVDVNLEYELAFATLRSISGYARSEVRNVDDCAGRPELAGCVRAALPNEFEQWSQELQLVIPGSRGISGIVGAYYSDSESELAFLFMQPALAPPLRNNSRSGFDDPAAAVFGQATASFADGWSATAGIRLSREKHRMHTIGTGADDSPALLVGDTDSDDVSWRLDLSHAINDEAMVYASVATGYKSGGFAVGRSSDGGLNEYDPEELIAFEAGSKTQWLEGRLALNAAAFYYDFTDLQVSTAVFDGSTYIFGIGNAAKAELYGIDAETSFQVSERWSLSGGVVWLGKREFTEYENDQSGDVLSGNELVRSPEWSVNAMVEYARPLHDLGGLTARVEYSYRSDYFYTVENNPAYRQDNFGLVNAFVRFDAASGRWYLFVSGRNLTDEDYYNQVFIQASPGYPDTYEIGVGYRF
jgi:iron complex outermembrane receptor protein